MARAVVEKLVEVGPDSPNCWRVADVLYAVPRSQTRGLADTLGVDAPTGGTTFERIPRGKVVAQDILHFLGQFFRVVGVRPRGGFGVLVDVETEHVQRTLKLVKPITVGGAPISIGGVEIVAC